MASVADIEAQPPCWPATWRTPITASTISSAGEQERGQSRAGIGLALFCTYVVWGSHFSRHEDCFRRAAAVSDGWVPLCPRRRRNAAAAARARRRPGRKSGSGVGGGLSGCASARRRQRRHCAGGASGRLVGSGCSRLGDRAAVGVAVFRLLGRVADPARVDRPRNRLCRGDLPEFRGRLRASPWGAVSVLVSSVCWAFGSIWSRRLPLPPGPFRTGSADCSAGASCFC